MSGATAYDAVVVGTGPNGLAAGIRLCQTGRRVLAMEAATTIGGGTRTAALTLPGFRHDVCSAIHPLGIASPFFRSLPLREYGLEWIHPDLPLAHPFDDGTAAILDRSLDATARALGDDGPAWRRLLGPTVRHWDQLLPGLLGPARIPRHPLALLRFGVTALRSASALAQRFPGTRGGALFSGLAGHSMLPLEHPGSGAFGLVLGASGHTVGWPFPRGGTQALAEALAAHFRRLGGSIETGHRVGSLAELPSAPIVLLDIAPRQFLELAGARLPAAYARLLERYRYGPGVYKLDLALSGPVPWRASECRRAGTVHLGGSAEEIARSEREVWWGGPPERPFVLVAQPSLFDSTRAPAGRHTLWAYCHVPSGSTADMSGRIEAQIERFAPGFRNLILGRHGMTAAAMEQYNPNYVGGDINGGVQDLRQLWTRPVPSLRPYHTPIQGVYLCSSSTPPGGGVHGMCGYWAAEAALGSMGRHA